MGVFKSPGVYVQERDISIVRSFSKRYLRRIKITRIYNSINIPSVTSTQKSTNPMYIGNIDNLDKIFGEL